MNKIFRKALLVLLLVPGLASAQGSKDVAAADFGTRWPFVTTKATLGCESGLPSVTVGSERYALTGAGAGRVGQPLTPDVAEWKENPNIPGTRVSIAKVRDAALKLCK